MVCHIFCSSLSHVGIAVFAFIPQVPFHASHRYCQPHARAVIHSLISFHSTHFTFRVYVFSHPANPCGCSRVPFHFTPLHTAHIHPCRSFALIHSIRSLLPALAFSNANVRAKKCAKLAAGSTQPPRSALPVSGAFAPLAYGSRLSLRLR